jgi:hypothetical protein
MVIKPQPTTNWKVGNDGGFNTSWDGKLFEQRCKILSMQPPHLIQYTLFFPRPDLEGKPENYLVLRIIQEDDRSGAKQEEHLKVKKKIPFLPRENTDGIIRIKEVKTLQISLFEAFFALSNEAQF